MKPIKTHAEVLKAQFGGLSEKRQYAINEAGRLAKRLLEADGLLVRCQHARELWWREPNGKMHTLVVDERDRRVPDGQETLLFMLDEYDLVAWGRVHSPAVRCAAHVTVAPEEAQHAVLWIVQNRNRLVVGKGWQPWLPATFSVRTIAHAPAFGAISAAAERRQALPVGGAVR